MHWYLKMLQNYVDFEGRAQRSEYWIAVLIGFVIYVVLWLVDQVTGLARNGVGLATIYSFAVLLPGLGLSVRRLHDTGHAGIWMLLLLLPCVGSIILLVFFVTDSEAGVNAYGPNPKASLQP